MAEHDVLSANEEYFVQQNGQRTLADGFVLDQDLVFLVVSGQIDVLLQNKDEAWQVFKTVNAGAALPVVSLHKLCRLYATPVKIFTKHESHLLVFRKSEVAAELFGPLKRSLLAKIEAQRGLHMLYGPGLASADTAGGSQASPHLMIVLAMVCQMKVSRLGERVVQKGEIPKGLHLVVEGEAQAVYDDAV